MKNIKDKDERKLEMMYYNLYDNFYGHFDDSIYFDKKHSPGFIQIETDNPVEEIGILVDNKGNFISDLNNDEMLDMQKMMNVLRNKTLIEGMMKGFEKEAIPIKSVIKKALREKNMK